jgi:hypothetical protein
MRKARSLKSQATKTMKVKISKSTEETMPSTNNGM